MDGKIENHYPELAQTVIYEWDIGYWFCCLNERERGVLRSTIITLAVSLYVGIPVDLWYGFWIGYEGTGDDVIESFLHIYGLEITVIVVGEPPVPMEVVVATDDFQYASWAAYLVSVGAICGDGCEQSRLP